MSSEWSKLYFVGFWVIGVVFFFNLVVGFVLDVFHQEYVATRNVLASTPPPTLTPFR